MRIHDYESGHELRDVDIELTRDEAEELAAYLSRMLTRADLRSVQITDVSNGVMNRELSVSLSGSAMVA